jgi:glycosyltransferase involved in cell wall biosynthesis
MVGGAEMALLRLVSGSQRGAYQHAIVSLSPGGPMVERFQSLGVEVIQLDFKKRPLATFVRLLGLLRKRRPHVVQTWMYHADLIGGIAARLVGNRNVIWGVRTTDVKANGGMSIRLLRSICAKLSAFLPGVIVCAAEASKHSHAAVGYDESRMAVVPNGFDFSVFNPDDAGRLQLRRACGIEESAIVVGTLGRFNPAKDPEGFVRAAGLLAKDWKNVRFLMVGRGFDWNNSELTQWIYATECAERFNLLGERSDVPTCLAAMDVFCLSSRTEGFPNALAEAMAMRLPFVTTDVGDAGMLAAETGLVVRKEAPKELASALHNLLAMNADQRRATGEAASRRVRDEFSLERMRRRFEQIYEEIIRKNKGFH